MLARVADQDTRTSAAAAGVGAPDHVLCAPARGPTAIVSGMADDVRIIVLEGDETGQELLEQAVRVLDPSVTQVDVELEHYDLSLENRRKTNNEVVVKAAARDGRVGLRPEGGDDHARGRRRRRQPEPDPARGDRRQGDHPHRPPDPGRDAGRRRALPDLGGPDGGRRRLRREAVARGDRGRRRDRAPRGADLARGVHRGGRAQLPDREEDPRPRVRRAEVDREPDLRGDAQGGARRGGGAPPRGALPAGADRRDVRRARVGRRRRSARDPGPEPRRRLPVGHGAAAVRVDRGRRVGAALARQRLRGRGR